MTVVVPSHNEEGYLREVLDSVPAFVDHVVVVDDGSTDRTSEVARSVVDSRIEVVRLPTNQGVGAAVVAGHKRALAFDSDISVVMAGDGQMDPAYLPKLLDPIADDHYDFTKGNRFENRGTLHEMPRGRVVGNALLTFLNKFATGYWHIFDPQNGYTAITSEALRSIPLDRLKRDYLFENSVLWELGLKSFRARDVAIPAVYRGQGSGIHSSAFSLSALRYFTRAFWRRIFVKFVIRDFHPVALFYILGTILLVWGVLFGLLVAYWSLGPAEASTGTVMMAVVPFFIGFQMLMTAITVDIGLAPR